MIFKPVLARAVAAGRKTQTRRPVRPGEQTCRYREGRTYAVQPGRGKPGIARIRILHTELQQLGDLTYQDAKAEGFRTRDDFYAYWTDLYNSKPDLAQPVWAIRFQVEADPPRLLHKDSSRGYTSDQRLAIPGEPEAIGEADLRRLHSARHAAEQQHRQERSIAARLREAQARARRVLAQLSVIAEARAARLDAAPIAHHKPGHRPPPWNGPSSYDHHARRIRHARTRAQLEAAIEAAEHELDAIRYARRRADTTTIDGKLELATCPGPAAKVARIYNVSVRHVYTTREWARRHGIHA